MTLPQEIYQDITAQLPAIKEALAQGVAYGGELMGRVIQYDLAWNIFMVILFTCFILISSYIFWDCKYKDFIITNLYIFILGMTLFIISEYSSDIIKDIYIPEIRVIEIISKFKLN